MSRSSKGRHCCRPALVSDRLSRPSGLRVSPNAGPGSFTPGINKMMLLLALSRGVSLANAVESSPLIRHSVHMTSAPNGSPVHFEGNVANIDRNWSMTVTSAPLGPPRRIDGYTIGAIPEIDGPGPHGGEVHPSGDEFLYVVNGTMELILDDGDERAVGVETKVLLRSGDAYVVPRGVWHRLEPVEPSYFIHVTPGPNGGYRPRNAAEE
jgi:mannose-6-phosphate isomerase-like protein (cupin superfamily)